jgi:transcriptional regulator with XRE-family HTH domain
MSESVQMAEIARRVRAARVTHGWSQVELAERAGVSRPTVARVEASEDVNTAKLMSIAATLRMVLEVNPDEL